MLLNNIDFNIDSIHIKLHTDQIYLIQDYIKENNLIQYTNKNKNNKYSKNIVKTDGTNISNKNIILFQYYKQTNQYSFLQNYIMIEIHGLKKYNKQDQIKKENLFNILMFFNQNNISYDIQKLDYAIDIKNKLLENVFIYKNSKRNKFNNIIDHDIKLNPFILENTKIYNTNRNNRLIAYDKSFKEHLEEEILRIEINLYPNVFREIRKKDDSNIILQEIKKQIEKYDIYLIEDIEKRTEIVKYHQLQDHKTNKRVKEKIDKLISVIDYEIIKYNYNDLEDLLCYF